MMGKSIGRKLRELRESARLSVKDVIKELDKMGFSISDKALYSYESGNRCASADMFLALCEIYHCNNVLEVFSDIEIDYSIPTDAEMRLIEKYRALDASGKEAVDYTIDHENTRSAKIADLEGQLTGVDMETDEERIEREVAEYRQELEIEARGVRSRASGDISGRRA